MPLNTDFSKVTIDEILCNNLCIDVYVLRFEQDEIVQQTATPPMFLQCDLHTYDLKDLNFQFDVILVEPPLEEYQQTLGSSTKLWNWNQVLFL